MKTLTYKSPVPRKEKQTGNYIYDMITLYNVELIEQFGHKVYTGTTTKKGKKNAYCCPSKVLELKTI
jgi:hypothetical protein